MDSEQEDFVFYGTPLEREEDITRKRKKDALDRGTLRISSSSQEVLDENGRRRFHGAFTGGFSAGYFNTVGSKEGWTPQSFTSSRSKRADRTQQKAYDFMDDEEKAEQDSSRLTTAADFDTFGFTAAEYARKEAEEELKKRPSAIPGFVPDEIIVPVSRSIGIQLLRKMGWRHGRAIGPKHIAASSDAQREGRKALLAFALHDQGDTGKEEEVEDKLLDDKTETDIELITKDVLCHVINPKNDRYGFGYDPYKNAPEFRERQQARESQDSRKGKPKQQDVISRPSLFRPNVGRMGTGFGLGALEELDEDDEDIYAPEIETEIAPSDEESYAPIPREKKRPLLLESTQKGVPGFRPAVISGFKVELFPPPLVPPDFDGVHKFTHSLDSQKVHLSTEPDEVPPPDDDQLRKLIDGLATFVARSGQKLETLYMEKRNSNPMFEFLNEGQGHAYYKRRLWEEHKKLGKEMEQSNDKKASMDSAQRGQLLGEMPLRRSQGIAPEDHSRLQSALASAFTQSSSSQILPEHKPFSHDPAKQARFEQFLKDRFQGGLRSAQSTGTISWSERERAQETIEFESACEKLQKKDSNQKSGIASGVVNLQHFQAMINDRFTPQTFIETEQPKEDPKPSKYPRRNEQPWRPLPLVCKRFNLPDPFAGKPPPVPKPRSRVDDIILLGTSLSKPTNSLENKELSGSQPQSTTFNSASNKENEENEVQVETIVEKPVDLYKAIFSDDEDEDEDDTDDHQKPSIEANSAEAAQKALNRLEAGDFLASIGKELGLKVPPPDVNQNKKAPDVSPLSQTIALERKQQTLTQPILSERKQQTLAINTTLSQSRGFEGLKVHNMNRASYEDDSVKTSHENKKDIKLHENRKKESESTSRRWSPSSEDESSSSGDNEDSGHRSSRKKRKKDRKHSRRHRDPSRDSQKSRKRSKDEERHSHKHHKHHRHKSRK